MKLANDQNALKCLIEAGFNTLSTLKGVVYQCNTADNKINARCYCNINLHFVTVFFLHQTYVSNTKVDGPYTFVNPKK